MFIQTLEKAPSQVTSAQVVKGQPTVLATVPPPGWKWPKRCESVIHDRTQKLILPVASSVVDLCPQAASENSIGDATDEEHEEETRSLIKANPTIATKFQDKQNGNDEHSVSVAYRSRRVVQKLNAHRSTSSQNVRCITLSLPSIG